MCSLVLRDTAQPGRLILSNGNGTDIRLHVLVGFTGVRGGSIAWTGFTKRHQMVQTGCIMSRSPFFHIVSAWCGNTRAMRGVRSRCVTLNVWQFLLSHFPPTAGESCCCFFPHTHTHTHTLFATVTRAVPVHLQATRHVGGLGPRGEAAGSRGIQPPLVLQDLMHSRLAGSSGDCVEKELEQRAGEGPLRCYGNDAAPAGDVGCTQTAACALAARACARSRKKAVGSGPQRPPVSTAKTTRWQRGERDSSG